MMRTIFGYLYDAIIRQYIKGAYDSHYHVKQDSSLKRASKTQFPLILWSLKPILERFFFLNLESATNSFFVFDAMTKIYLVEIKLFTKRCQAKKI